MSTRFFLATSIAALIAGMPTVAHASDDTSDMRARLDALTAEMRTMHEQQLDLERRLAASEARGAAPSPQPGQVAGGSQIAVSAPEATPALSATQSGSRGSGVVRRSPLPPGQVVSAEVAAPPPGTISSNPFYRNKPFTPGKGATFLIPGTDTSVQIGGLIKVDVIDDVSGANLNGVAIDPVSVAIDGTPQAKRRRNLTMTARQTRFNIGSETPTRFGPLKSFLEGDFYGTGGTALITNSAGFRLRHAYLSLGHVLVGQTWSVFQDLEVAPETLDLTGPVGNAYAIRQPQVRYTRALGSHGKLTLAIENAEGDFFGADHTANIPVGSTMSTRVLNQIPDFTARYVYQGSRVRLSVAGVLRYINLDTGGAPQAFQGPNGSFNFAGKAATWGGGVQGTAQLKTWGNDTLTLQGNGGPGLGRYVMGPQDEAFAIGVAPYGSINANPGNGAVLGADGKLRTIFTVGATAWYRHYWSKTLRSNASVGYEHWSDPASTLPINYIETLMSAHVNLIWSPLPQVAFGVEYIHSYLGLRGQTDANRILGYGTSGAGNRIQFSAQYNLF